MSLKRFIGWSLISTPLVLVAGTLIAVGGMRGAILFGGLFAAAVICSVLVHIGSRMVDDD